MRRRTDDIIGRREGRRLLERRRGHPDLAPACSNNMHFTGSISDSFFYSVAAGSTEWGVRSRGGSMGVAGASGGERGRLGRVVARVAGLWGSECRSRVKVVHLKRLRPQGQR